MILIKLHRSIQFCIFSNSIIAFKYNAKQFVAKSILHLHYFVLTPQKKIKWLAEDPWNQNYMSYKVEIAYCYDLHNLQLSSFYSKMLKFLDIVRWR